MLIILNSLKTNNFPIFQPILMILVSKFMVYRALSEKNILIIRAAVPFKLPFFVLSILSGRLHRFYCTLIKPHCLKSCKQVIAKFYFTEEYSLCPIAKIR